MSTHTYVILELSPAAFNEIKASLEKAGYEHAFHEDASERLIIDMQGLAVATEFPKLKAPKITKTICRVEERNGKKVWVVTHNDYDLESVGDVTACGLPCRAQRLPVGSTHESVMTVLPSE